MSAAENLARWREAEQGATEGPWETRHERNDDGDWVGADIVHTYRNERVCWPNQILATADLSPEDADFIATSRTAMPALLAFAEAVLTEVVRVRDAHEKRGGGRRVISCTTLDRLAETHLGDSR